jgi:hypothetical protein
MTHTEILVERTVQAVRMWREEGGQEGEGFGRGLA